MGKIVILQNRDSRGVQSIPVIGRSGKKYGSATVVPGQRIVEFRMSKEEWDKSNWDIAQGGRRAGYTFYVADIIDGELSAIKPKPIISEPKAEAAEVQSDPFAGIPDFTGDMLGKSDPPPSEPYPEPEPEIPPSGEPSGACEARRGELEGLSFRGLRSIAKSAGVDVSNLNKSAQLIQAILVVEFP